MIADTECIRVVKEILDDVGIKDYVIKASWGLYHVFSMD